jgi:hypothetical protein
MDSVYRYGNQMDYAPLGLDGESMSFTQGVATVLMMPLFQSDFALPVCFIIFPFILRSFDNFKLRIFEY